MVSTLTTIAFGILIGILVSCPMGPTGILCVQRTLLEGRRSGLLTGLGASLSDIFYAALCSLGVGVVIDVLDKYRAGIEIFASIVLIIFGIYTFFSVPRYVAPDKDQEQKGDSYLVVSSFLLTLSNPLIIFFYLALFSFFPIFSEHVSPLLTSIILLVSIEIGALLWWWLVTLIVSRLRVHLRPSRIRLLNHVIAILLIAAGILHFFL